MAQEKKEIKGTTVIGTGNDMVIIPKSSKKSSSSESTSKSSSARSSSSTNNGDRTIVYGEGQNMAIIPKQSSGSRSTSRSSSGGGGGTNYGSYETDLQRLTQAQRQAQVDQLKAARTKALANLDAQEQKIKPYYQTARNQIAAASQQGARNFSEYLANRGLTNSGAAAQGEINRLSGLNNNLGNLNTAEANAFRDIANQRTAVENDYVAGLANANNAITSNYYNNLLNYNEQQRQLVNQLQQQALGQYAGNYQAYMDTLDPNSMEYLYAAAARGNKVANQYNSGINNALANIQAGNINYNNAAALGMTIPQAQQYYETYKAQQEATALANQQALEREVAQQQWNNDLKYNQYLLDAQKVANDTAQTNYNINKPYFKPTQSKNTSYTLNDYLDELAADGKIDFETYKKLYQ